MRKRATQIVNWDISPTINTTRYNPQCWSWNYNKCSKIAVSVSCDPKGKFKSCHHDLNMLRVKLATRKDASLSRIPPIEPSFKQQFWWLIIHLLILLVNIGCLLVGQTILTKITSLTWAQLSAAYALLINLLYHVFTAIFVVCIDCFYIIMYFVFVLRKLWQI
jgi:hypothetical protein